MTYILNVFGLAYLPGEFGTFQEGTNQFDLGGAGRSHLWLNQELELQLPCNNLVH